MMMTGYAQGYVTYCIFLLLGISNIMYMIICLNPNVIYSMHIKED